MKQSQFPIKTFREYPKNELALNAKLLMRAGFIDKVGAGIYSYLPLGLRVIRNIEQIVREEMNAIKGRELLLPALHPKSYWQKTGRWDTFDALYRINAREDREYALGPTHEEIIVPLAKNLIQSYKDLPLYLYQIQTKFRDEPRAKAGLLRGREFIMKDLYSFHTDANDMDTYFEIVAAAYGKIFNRCGLPAVRTKASGGTFSKFSDEYQVLTSAGEDTIFLCQQCDTAWNKEIIGIKRTCPSCKKELKEEHATEVGNIFKLGTGYSKPFDLQYQAQDGSKRDVIMGCYGIGVSRLMGVAAEVHHDEKGIIWPDEIAPFAVHLIEIKNSKVKSQNYNVKFKMSGENVYQTLLEDNIKVLYDDREDKTAGEKLTEADLIGIPLRIVVSEKTLKERKVEVKKRSETDVKLMTIKEFLQNF